MPWIESHTALDKHPKTLLLKRRMRWSQNETIGFLHRFWWTVLDYAPNGVVSTLSQEVIAESLAMESSVLAKAITEMEVVGFLRKHNGVLLVNDWDVIGPGKRVERNREGRRRRRARVRGTIPDLTRDEWTAVLEYFGGWCAYCLRPATDLVQDHVEPIAAGGRHTVQNVVPACRSCNGRKSDLPLLAFVTGFPIGRNRLGGHR